MASFEFKLPDIGEGVSEGEIVEWHVKPGDRIHEDDPMVEVMTDKATVTIGAPKTGMVADLRVGVGSVARVGEVLVVIETTATANEVSSQPRARTSGGVSTERPPNAGLAISHAPAAQGTAASAVGDIREGLPGVDLLRGAGTAPSRTSLDGDNGASMRPSSREYFSPKPLATPAIRKLARDLGVDLRRVPPTGEGGKVTKHDVSTFAGGRSTGRQTAELPAVGLSKETSQGREERRPFIGIRRKIAERLQVAKNTAAHFTFVEECDVTRLVQLRNTLSEAANERGARLTFLPFVVKAVVAALKKHPVLNCWLDEKAGELVFRHYYHIGIATSTENGLLVPVLRDADKRSIVDLAREIERLSEGARRGTLGPSDLKGSTFTITSLGKRSGLFATPILNHPEVGILGVHRIKEKPVVRQGRIEVGNVMLVSLSFDHRVVDGDVGAAFAYDVIGHLEQPERSFVDLVFAGDR